MSAGGIVGAGLGAAAIGGSVYQGQQQKRAQRRAERTQEHAQNLATSRAAAELRRQDQAERKLNRKRPNITSLLGAEREKALSGPGATVLTGATGVARERTTLGKSSLLGGA